MHGIIPTKCRFFLICLFQQRLNMIDMSLLTNPVVEYELIETKFVT